MSDVTLDQARAIVAAAFSKASEMGLNPLTIVVLDSGGAIKVLERTDGSSLMRPEIAIGKANGAIQLGLGSRAIFNRAQEQPYFIQAMNTLAKGSLVPVPGGVLIRDSGGAIVGAVGVTGDTSDNDEACAVAGIQAVGLTAETG
jgi:uncharacterized protein GlcG (DUF336 family)